MGAGWRRGWRLVLATGLATGLAGLALWPVGASAHEMPENRLTVVLRDQRHLALVLRIDAIETLRRRHAPQSEATPFLLSLAAMPDADLEPMWRQLRSEIESGLSLRSLAGESLRLSNWQWPALTVLRAMLQEQAMAAVVAPQAHQHAPALEVRVDALASRMVEGLRIELSPLLKPMLVVWYRPGQVWVEPGAPVPLLRF